MSMGNNHNQILASKFLFVNCLSVFLSLLINFDMEQIVLEVNAITAKKWLSASAKLKAELSKFMEQQISTIMDKKQQADSVQYFNELREEMANKGLTQEILDDILKNED